MSDVIHKYGAWVDSLSVQHPKIARSALNAGFRAFGAKLKYKPDPRLPKSGQQLAVLMNRVVVGMLSHPNEAALTSIFTPTEMLHAAGMRPLCAELYSAFVNGAYAESAFIEEAEAHGIAETFCSYHKVLIGSAYRGVFPKPRFVINTSLACDANNLTFREMARFFDIDQFYIDVPPEANPEAEAYVADQLRELRLFIEDHIGKKIPDEAIAEAIRTSDGTLRRLKKTQPLKAVHYLPSDIASELYELYVTHIGLGTKECVAYADQLYHDYQNAPDAFEETADGRKSRFGKRILWVHTVPNWQPPVREMFNYSDRAQIIACDMGFDALYPQDPKQPYESMAHRLVCNTFNGSGERRIEKAKEMARFFHADGVIVFCHWGCKQTMGLSMRFKEELEEAGFPTLILNGDGCDENNSSNGQVATRLEAFMEMLEEHD